MLNLHEQIKTGTHLVRLKPEDWQSGPVNWLLDVIAPDRKAMGQVIANFRQVVKEGDLRIHPIVAGLVDEEMRGKMMGAVGQSTAFTDINRTDMQAAASRKPFESKES